MEHLERRGAQNVFHLIKNYVACPFLFSIYTYLLFGKLKYRYLGDYMYPALEKSVRDELVE